MARSDTGIGAPVRRKEDRRLLTGNGEYTGDLKRPGLLHAVMVRAQYGHARILEIDIEAASAMPGVVAVITGATLVAAGLHPIPHLHVLNGGIDVALRNKDGSAVFISRHMPLPTDKVRYVGEPLAMVLADSLAAARDAAECVSVSLDPLPAVVTAQEAARPDAPLVWEEAGSNVFLDAQVGDHVAADAAFARAAHVVKLAAWAPRIAGVPLEPRVALVEHDERAGRCTIHVSGGFGGRMRTELAAVLGVTEDGIRFILPDAGGNFGTKNFMYVEYPTLGWAARRFGRPIKWASDRTEAFLTDYQARDLTAEMELAMDATGRFLAIRGSLMVNVGAHTVSYVPLVKGAGIIPSLYDIPAAGIRARGVGSNTAPITPFRSAGRPEAIWVIERLIDLAARRCGFDRVALRRANLIQPSQFPYRSATGLNYDSGEYERVMDRALAMGDWAGFPARRAEAAARGRKRGIGLCNYIEVTSGAPRERARIAVHPSGTVDLEVGTLPSGQGHLTAFAQLMVTWLGVDFEKVQVVCGDTDRTPVGGGSHSGRSMRMISICAGDATDILLGKARRIAALMLDAEADALVFEKPAFVDPATGRRADLFEIARAAEARNDLPDELRAPLDAMSDQMMRHGGFPYGAHVAEVEVDPETGVVQLVRYAAVDDVGTAVNPMILHGQTHGGIVHGAGQAMMEQLRYEAGSGQLHSASFMDYAVPRADTMPSFDTDLSQVPSPTNKLGVRAGGEGGTTGALGAIGNAVADALAEYGVEHIDMPLTPEKVWRAINAARTSIQEGN